MNKAELTAKLEAIDKELLPLFAKKGRSKEECERVASLDAEYNLTKAKLDNLEIKEMMADPAYRESAKARSKHLKALPKEA